MFKVHSIFDVPGDPGITFTEESLAQQHFAADADINTIMARYESTGFLVDPMAEITAKPMFDDFSVDFDFQQTQNLLIEAQQRFMGLPASLRQRFSNDPGQLLEFLSDPQNRDEAIRLGLVDAPASPPATPPEPSNQPPVAT